MRELFRQQRFIICSGLLLGEGIVPNPEFSPPDDYLHKFFRLIETWFIT